MLAATPAELAERRQGIARTPTLARLRDRLRAQVQPLLDGPIYLPSHKALLSRDGGVCPGDGSRFRFDPFSPDRHQCPRCGRWFEGERHHRAWIVRYQIWLSERSIHLALLGSLNDDPLLGARAAEILAAYADRYRDYPNRDNVLGPTRLFFSTYLESIWLCQIVTAASLLEAHGFSWPSGVRDRLRAMVAESAELIASFDEGWSNRQAWNNAALIGAGRWLGAPELVSRGLEGPHGIRAALQSAVSADGLWFEGENYHFFALRGLLLGVEFLRRVGPDLYAEPAAGAVLAALYVAPLKTVLPDLTLPARGDSPFGVSLLQPRFPELWEVGRARTGAPALEHMLAHLYSAGPPAGEDFGMTELSEQEQNRPAQHLSRDRLSWKALLWMREADPEGQPGAWQAGSVLLADHGVAVLRQGDRYVSMECGGHRGGHGHPDLLHVTLFWSAPWLMDFGTGSYVSPSLHWYRSTLAHNAPGVAGENQLSRDGRCVAFAEHGPWAWVRAEATDLFGPETRASRTLVAGPDWVLDVLDVHAPPKTEIDAPLHPLGMIVLPSDVDREPTNAPGLERAATVLGQLTRVSARSRGAELIAAFAPRAGERCYVATAPGPSDLSFADGGLLDFVVRRASGRGRWVQAYARRPIAVEEKGSEVRVSYGNAVDTVNLSPKGATVRTAAGGAVQLAGLREPAVRAAVKPSPRREIPSTLRLGVEHYRRSEEPYDASDFSAEVTIGGSGRELTAKIEVTEGDLVVRRSDAPDPALDNEPPDIHSDGVQFYVDWDGWQGFMLVPDPDSERVYIRPVAGTDGDPRRLKAAWKRIVSGYEMSLAFDVGRRVRRGDRFPVNLVINRMRPGRERRAGQLVLSGDAGWVYLRGDRESPETAVVVEIA